MVTKKIILLLLVLSVIISGCLSSEDEKEKDRKEGGSAGGSQRQREVKTPEGMQEETWTPQGTEIQEETETPAESGTQVESNTPEMGTLGTPGTPSKPEMEKTEVWTGKQERAGTIQPSGTTPTSHLIRLKNYLMIPSSLKIDIGDTVVWRNYQESSMLTLTSKEHLFEDQRLAYGNTLEYTFNESGSYNFSVKGYPKMQTTITVK